MMKSDSTTAPFLFSPDSEMWKVNCYACGLIYGPAAVLLQVAHPRVAQGVADHSDFKNDGLGRLKRTLNTVNRIAFGTEEEAEAMKARLKHVHGQVRGDTSEGMPGARKYSAFEPDLLMWVLATLIDASIRGYEFIWEPLSAERREHFYQDFRKFGTYFGLSEAIGPANYSEFEVYFEEMLDSDLLGSHPLCAEVAASVVSPPHPLRDRCLGKLVNFLPIETVPAVIRERLGLKSSWWTRTRMKLLRCIAPALFRILPKRITYYPEAFHAHSSMKT